MDEWLWMCSIPGLYRPDFARLLEYFKTPEQIRSCSEKEIDGLAFLKDKQKNTLKEYKKKPALEEVRNNMKKSGIHFISCQEENYPELLKEISDYPFGIFYKGKLPGKGEHCVAIVGARMCSNYGRGLAREIAVELTKRNVSIISGMAFGIDGIAQSACLSEMGKSYAVTGCGPDICYPRDHISLYQGLQEKGGIISEFPPGVNPLPLHFPLRNRIISGLSKEVIVIEAKNKSGSLITADMALEQGRDVFALPGRVNDPLSSGCNQLIAQGAGIITGIDELMRQLGFETEKHKKNRKTHNLLATSENMVYICLDFRPKNISEIMSMTELPVQEVMSILTGLQMKNLVEEVSNNYYVRKQN